MLGSRVKGEKCIECSLARERRASFFFFLLVEEDELNADWLGTILSFSLFLIIQSVASVRLYLGVITFGMQRIRS